MCVSITPLSVVFGGPGPWTNWLSRKGVLQDRLLNFLEDNCSLFNLDVFFSVTMTSHFEKVDEEHIEELKAKGENENTKNSTKSGERCFKKVGE